MSEYGSGITKVITRPTSVDTTETVVPEFAASETGVVTHTKYIAGPPGPPGLDGEGLTPESSTLAYDGDGKLISVTKVSGGTAYTGTGVVALCIVKPLCDLPLPVTGAWGERDLVNQLMSMPQIQDGACIVPMIFSTGATTNNSPLNMAMDFAWGG